MKRPGLDAVGAATPAPSGLASAWPLLVSIGHTDGPDPVLTIRDDMRDELKWTLLVGGATVVASWVARRTLAEGWQRALGDPPPADPDLDEAGALSVVGWSMAVAGAAGLARVLARKGAATAWRHATSEEPPVHA